jgi:roadblock/LC7 domain-containing protein
MSVSQHSSAFDYPDHIQRTYDCSIIKSADHGKTWSAKRREPTFPSPRFSTPFFVEFGKNYEGAFDEYVYAVSSGCSWNNGNFMTLGRVERSKIKDLRGTDWEMFNGLDEHANPKWRRFEIGALTQDWPAIFKWRGYSSMTGMQWVPAVKRFLMPQWAYADLDGSDPWAKTILHLYEAPKPWGPWRLVHLEQDFGKAWYNPCFCSKWFEEDGLRMWMIAAGDFASVRVKDQGEYGFFVRKLELVL